MHDSIADLLPLLDRAIAECEALFGSEKVGHAVRARDRLWGRSSYPEDITIVALAGGTGSGKSSLFNAIAGEELAVTGGLRPTTSHPIALVPETKAAAMESYIAAIGVEEMVTRGVRDWLCLIDLPDTDSVVTDHRMTVEGVLPWVDVVVWVVDPEKYRDASLHTELVTPLIAQAGRFVFVLNQIDRIASGSVPTVTADLTAALLEDGIADPVVLAVAASPGVGPPIGIDALIDHLEEMAGGGAAAKGLLTDFESASEHLSWLVGDKGGVDFDRRWDAVRRAAVSQTPADGGVTVAAFLHDIADEVDGEAGAALRRLANEAPSTLLSVRAAGSRRRSWWRRSQREADQTTLQEEDLESLVGEPAREILADRARAQAVAAELRLAVHSLATRNR